MTRLAKVTKLVRVSGLGRLVGMTMLAVMTCVMRVAMVVLVARVVRLEMVTRVVILARVVRLQLQSEPSQFPLLPLPLSSHFVSLYPAIARLEQKRAFQHTLQTISLQIFLALCKS